MGEISFLYQIKNNPAYMQIFRYQHEKAIEYSLAYQRYVTLSDTSIINSPVAITKVAAGLSNLHGLFVTNREPMIPDKLDGFNVVKNPKSTIEYEQSSIKQEGHSKEQDLEKITWFVRDGHEDKKRIVERYENGKFLARYLHLNDDIRKKNYSIMMGLPHKPYANVLESYFGYFSKEASMYKTDLHSYIPKPVLNIIYQLYGKLPGITGNIQDTLNVHRDDPIVNHIPNLYGWRPDPIGNKIETINTSRPDPIVNYIKDGMAKNANPFTLNIIKTMLARRPDLIGNKIDLILAKPADKIINLNDIYGMGTTIRTGSVNYTFMGKRFDYNGNILPVINGKPTDNYMNVNNHYNAFRYENKMSYFDLDDFVIRETRYGFVCNNYVVNNYMWNLDVFNNECFSERNKTFGGYDKYDSFATNKEKDIMTAIGVYGCLGGKEVRAKKNGIHTSKTGKELRIQRRNITAFKDKLLFDDKIFGNVFVYKVLKDMSISDSGVFYSKFRKGMWSDTTFTDIYKTRKGMWIDNSGVHIYKITKDMVIADVGNHVYKTPYDLAKDPIANDIIIHKNAYSFVIDETLTWYEKIIANSEPIVKPTPPEDRWTKTPTSSLVGVYRVPKDATYFRTGIDILKMALSTDYITDYEFVLKDWLPLSVIPDVVSKYDGMIIPVSKSRVQSFIDSINKMAVKYHHELFIDVGTSGSVIPKNSYIPEMNLFCDKEQHSLMIDYYNHWLAKEGVKASISKDKYLTKSGHRGFLFGHIWLNKNLKELYSFKMTDTLRVESDASVNDKLFVQKDLYVANHHDDLFATKDNRVCYYYYDVIADKKNTLTNIFKMLPVPRKEYTANTFADVTATIEHLTLNDMYKPILFPSKMIENKLSILSSFGPVDKQTYDMSVYLQDNGNWGWVYELPDPFTTDNPFSIDELLLPENDTRYEDFEDIIFDRETLMPRDPVRMIDETTFVAKFPIEHPIRDYANIGKIYDNSAEHWDNYFGIQTDVMHEIFLKYYQIWQSKIFEFATMTMHQSTNKMLDLLYTWITLYYPIDKMEQALRVFRQIRWYSESAIIRNSQYIISYEFDSLRSNLHTGRCEIPNDLDDGNETMYIESGVIRNNPAYIGQEASVTFNIDIRKNTVFTFSLSNQVGTVKVYLNGNLVGMYPKSGIGYTINLPYTGQTNYVKIVKEANHNLDKNFYIGFIEIPGASFKDLSIKFDPVLRAGNKPLDEVAKKLIAYANLHANRNEMYQIAKRNNAGITDTYQKMNDYWKNHHQNQSKGKRLTIRQL